MTFHKKNLTFIALSLAAAAILISACKKDTLTETPLATVASTESYASLADFFKQNEVQPQTFTIDVSKGGTFTGAKGTVFTIPPNAFVNGAGNLVTGNLKFEIKEIYDKSDMLLSNKPTALFIKNNAAGIPQEAPLKSGGEFFIRAVIDSGSIRMRINNAIKVVMPAAAKVDSMMKPFVQNAVQPQANQNFNWVPNQLDTLKQAPSSYIYSIYSFSSTPHSGKWCNNDNSTFFPANNQVAVTFEPTDAVSVYGTAVFLVLKNVNTEVLVHPDGGSFPYNYAPNGEAGTLVAIGYKDGKFYSAFVPLTITPGATIKFTLTPTTSADLKAKIKALN